METLNKELVDNLSYLINSINAVAILASDTISGSEEASASIEEQSAIIEQITASAQELSTLSNNLQALLVRFSF